jgi:hypothetical protein
VLPFFRASGQDPVERSKRYVRAGSLLCTMWFKIFSIDYLNDTYIIAPKTAASFADMGNMKYF